SAHTTEAALSLYRSLLRTSKKFTSYNFREYALRRVRDGFHSCKSESDPRSIEGHLLEARNQLLIMKRQTTISEMYKFDKLVVE
ncbi:hypothetical protein V1511DRAFT_450297, partial [Dipodascopsis uninucleata]